MKHVHAKKDPRAAAAVIAVAAAVAIAEAVVTAAVAVAMAAAVVAGIKKNAFFRLPIYRSRYLVFRKVTKVHTPPAFRKPGGFYF